MSMPNCNTADNRQLHKIYCYNLFISCAITIVAQIAFIDRLLLRMDIDLGMFGFVKSIMFLLPAVIYQASSGFMQKLDRDVNVCIYCYLLRLLIPLGLPVLAIFCRDRMVLTVSSMILLPLGMLCAVFANNSLMSIYRRVIPLKSFNYKLGMINMFMAIPGSLLALPAAWLIDRFDRFNDTYFFIFFSLLQIAFIAFEIPAILAMRNLKIPPLAVKNKAEKKPKSLQLQPYRDQKCRIILLIMFLHNLGIGLASAYLTIYFLQVLQISMTSLILIISIRGFIVNFMSPLSGKLTDRWGYSRMFMLLSAGMAAGLLLFCIFWKELWLLPLFVLLMWDGSLSLCGSLLSQGELAAVSKNADPQWLAAAIAACTVCCNGGAFLGLTASSGVYYLLKTMLPQADLSTLLHVYFWCLLPLFILLITVIRRFHSICRQAA